MSRSIRAGSRDGKARCFFFVKVLFLFFFLVFCSPTKTDKIATPDSCEFNPATDRTETTTRSAAAYARPVPSAPLDGALKRPKTKKKLIEREAKNGRADGGRANERSDGRVFGEVRRWRWGWGRAFNGAPKSAELGKPADGSRHES